MSCIRSTFDNDFISTCGSIATIVDPLWAKFTIFTTDDSNRIITVPSESSLKVISQVFQTSVQVFTVKLVFGCAARSRHTMLTINLLSFRLFQIISGYFRLFQIISDYMKMMTITDIMFSQIVVCVEDLCEANLHLQLPVKIGAHFYIVIQ